MRSNKNHTIKHLYDLVFELVYELVFNLVFLVRITSSSEFKFVTKQKDVQLRDFLINTMQPGLDTNSSKVAVLPPSLLFARDWLKQTANVLRRIHRMLAANLSSKDLSLAFNIILLWWYENVGLSISERVNCCKYICDYVDSSMSYSFYINSTSADLFKIIDKRNKQNADYNILDFILYVFFALGVKGSLYSDPLCLNDLHVECSRRARVFFEITDENAFINQLYANFAAYNNSLTYRYKNINRLDANLFPCLLSTGFPHNKRINKFFLLFIVFVLAFVLVFVVVLSFNWFSVRNNLLKLCINNHAIHNCI